MISSRSTRTTSLSAAPLFLIIAWAVPAMASPPEVAPKDFIRPPVTSPYAFRNVPDRVFFGDMHIHSNLSPDAGLLGTSLTAADVFRAARGETVMSNTGQPFRLVRPLDFLVLTDHAEAMGLSPMLREADPVLLSSRFGRELWQAFNAGPAEAQAGFKQFVDYATGGKDPFADIDMAAASSSSSSSCCCWRRRSASTSSISSWVWRLPLPFASVRVGTPTRRRRRACRARWLSTGVAFQAAVCSEIISACMQTSQLCSTARAVSRLLRKY
jgi:hypothetical protein